MDNWIIIGMKIDGNCSNLPLSHLSFGKRAGEIHENYPAKF